MIVIVSGGFDPLHVGHLELIKNSAKLGKVIVLLNSDDWLVRKKGKAFMPFEEREAIIKSLKYVDSVLAFNDDDGSACDGIAKVLDLYPNSDLAFANGGDRNENTTPEVTYCESNSIELLWNMSGDVVRSSSDMLANHFHKLVRRHWGLWSVIKSYPHVKVKELIVYPQEMLSYQKHKLRSEIWFVVSGSPVIYTDNDEFRIHPQTYLEIPVDSWHRIYNDSTIEPVHIIEIQYGEKCIETDIIRDNELGEKFFNDPANVKKGFKRNITAKD